MAKPVEHQFDDLEQQRRCRHQRDVDIPEDGSFLFRAVTSCLHGVPEDVLPGLRRGKRPFERPARQSEYSGALVQQPFHGIGRQCRAAKPLEGTCGFTSS